MWIRVKMKSAWKLTQGLDWEQSLFCSKICERVQYIMQRSHEQRGCADATTTRCSRLRRVHLVLTNISQSLTGFRARDCSHSRGSLWIRLCPRVLFLLFNLTVNRARFYIDEPASYSDVSLSLDENVRATVCTLPMVPCGSSPVTRVSRSPLRWENEAPEEEAVDEQFDLHATKCICISANRIHHFYLRELTQTWTHLHHHNPLLLQALWEEKLLKHRSPLLP